MLGCQLTITAIATIPYPRISVIFCREKDFPTALDDARYKIDLLIEDHRDKHAVNYFMAFRLADCPVVASGLERFRGELQQRDYPVCSGCL